MRKRRTQIPAVLVASIVLATMALPATNALASSGEFTRAEANADWTLGSVAGSASWGGCEHGGESPPGLVASSGCTLQPYVTVGTSECSSSERRWPHSNGKLALAWSGAEHSGGGSQSFDVSEVPLSGEPGQLACLTLLETYEARPYCQLHPEPGVACPMFILDVQNPVVLAEAPLTQGSTPLQEEPPSIEGESVSHITATDATVEAQINPGDLETEYQFRVIASPCHAAPLNCEVVSDPLYPSPAGKISAGSGGQTVKLDLNSAGLTLAPGTEYHYAVFAKNSEGTEGGPDQTFTTPSAPTIDSESATNVAATGATLEAQINPQSEERGVYYQFQLAQNPADFASEFTCPTEGFPAGSSLCLGIASQQGALPISSIPAGTADQSVSLDLESAGVGLELGTTYYYRVIAARIVPTEDTTHWEEPIAYGEAKAFKTTSESPPSSAQRDDPSDPLPLSPTTTQPLSSQASRQYPNAYRRRHHRHHKRFRRHRRARHTYKLYRASRAG